MGIRVSPPSGGGASLPSQTGNAGKYLQTDGSSASWQTVVGGVPLTVTPVKTANYTAAAGELARFDTTSGALALTLPTTPADGACVGGKIVTLGTGNSLTVNAGGSATVNKTGGVTSFTLSLLGQGFLATYKASDNTWTVQADDLPLAQLDSRYVLASNVTTATAADVPFTATGTIAATNVQAALAEAASEAAQKASNLSDLASASSARTNLGLAALATKSTIAVPGDITATGTPDATTYLRGDGSWATPSGGGGSSVAYTGPKLNELLLWNMDVSLAGSASAVTAGVVYVTKLLVPVTTTFTNVYCHVLTAGVTLTNCYLAVYDSSGTRLGVTADQSSAWTSTGPKSAAFASSFSVTGGSSTFVWVAFLVGSFVTSPQFARGAATAANQVNLGTTAATSRAASILTGQTSLPSSITPGSLVADVRAYFAGVS